MSDEQTELPTTELPVIPPSAFEVAFAMLTIIADAKAFGAKLRSLQEHQAAAAAAAAELITARSTFEQETASTRAELAAERGALDKRRLAVHEAEGLLAHREAVIRKLELAWRNIGEPDTVISGFQDPERSALHKARRAHGFDTDVADELVENFSIQMPPDVTLTNSTPARNASARRAQRQAMER
jgi:hypothetical protein